MPAIRLLIEQGSTLNSLRLGIVGEAGDIRPFFTLHLRRLGNVREEAIWATALNPDQVGRVVPQEIKNIQDGDLYCAYVCCEETYQFSMDPNIDNVILKQHFQVIDNQIVLISESNAAIKRQNQLEKNMEPLYAKDGHEPDAIEFEIVIFLAGIQLHNASAMKGISLLPVTPGLSNISSFEAVSDFLLKRHTVTLPKGADLKSWLQHQPMFAIDFHKIFALTKNSAFEFATEFAQDIATIIGSERGDKPFPVISFILEHKTGNWQVVPSNFDFRGNLLPPLFTNAHAENIERLYPIIQSRPYARLVLELYVQSLAERDRSFCFLRQWTILEMIADKRIAASDDKLLNLDGSEIKLVSGKNLTTRKKEGKVYAYLRGGDLPAIYQGVVNGPTRVIEGSDGGIDQGAGIISLWASVSAAYRIRNDVAHEGHFNPKNPERDSLCKDLYLGQFGFLDHALNYSVWREIFQDK